MNRKKHLGIIMLFISAMLVGCSSRPEVKLQRYLESGRRLSVEGKYKEASIQFLNALRVDEDSADAHYELAQTYEHLGEFRAARDELERTIDDQPGNFKAHIELGNLLVASGKYEEALKQADIVQAAIPQNPDGHALRSAIAARRGEHDQALAEIGRALELDPDRAAFHESLALLESGEPERAAFVESELKKAIALSPKSLDPRLLLTAFYSRKRQLVEAERAAWDAVAIDPRSVTARVTVAQIILKQGDEERAELVMRQTAAMLGKNLQGQRLMADYYAEIGQFDKAKSRYSEIAAKYPGNLAVQKAYVRVLIQAGDYATAKGVLAGVMKDQSSDPEAEALDAILHLKEGDGAEAVNVLRDSSPRFPQDAFIQYWVGQAALFTGDLNLAETSFRQVIDLNPSARGALFELARIASLRGDMTLLSEVAEDALSTSPQLPDGYVWRATVETDRNLLNRAVIDLNHAIAISPHCWQAYLQLGKIRLAQKRFTEGVALLEEASAENQGSVEALRLLVAYDLHENRLDRALERVNAGIGKNPQNSHFYDLLAELQIQSNALDQAAATAKKAIQLNPQDGEAVSLVVQSAVRRGSISSAIDSWQKWSNEHPRDFAALAILGALEESRGETDKAEADYKKALQIQPSQAIAANNLAYLMLSNGRTPELALSLAQVARKGMPDSPQAADTLAWAYFCNGEYEFARNLLEDAVRVNPKNAVMQYHLGMVYAKLFDKSNATVHLKMAISLAPDSLFAKDAKIALRRIG